MMLQSAKVIFLSHLSGFLGMKNAEKCQKCAFFDLEEKKSAKKFASSKNGSNFATLFYGDIV